MGACPLKLKHPLYTHIKIALRASAIYDCMISAILKQARRWNFANKMFVSGNQDDFDRPKKASAKEVAWLWKSNE